MCNLEMSSKIARYNRGYSFATDGLLNMCGTIEGTVLQLMALLNIGSFQVHKELAEASQNAAKLEKERNQLHNSAFIEILLLLFKMPQL